MNDGLLNTKFHIPTTHSSFVARPHLIDKLNEGTERPLILVSAPAGFGKTSLIAAWITELIATTERMAYWLSLDEDDNNSEQFFTYIAAAIRPLTYIQSTLSLLLHSPQVLSAKVLMKAFLQDVMKLTAPFLLVLDDFHLIQSNEINEAIAFLLDHMPPHMQIVITCRADPKLPLSRLRARQQLTEIRAADLRLSQQEVAFFFNELRQLNLTTADIITLQDRTEGWVSGLQLAAISLAKLNENEKHHFVTTISGDNRYILDYLLDEVLTQQSKDVQIFLLKTAVLDRFTAPLCDALITESGTTTDEAKAQQILQQLERENLFLIPLDHKRGWYRYHHLFADLLSYQLQTENAVIIPNLHKKACQWFEHEGYLADAFTHAWKSKDVSFVVQFLNRHARQMLVQADWKTLVSWLNKMPSNYLEDQPQLCIYYAWTATILFQLETAVTVLQWVVSYLTRASLDPEEKNDWLGQIAAVQGFIATRTAAVDQTVAHSERALSLLSPQNMLHRGLALNNLTIAHWFAGDSNVTLKAAKLALPINQQADNITETINLYGIMAQASHEMGELQTVEAICRQALQRVARYTEREGLESLPVAASIYIQLGQLYYEWNRLDEAAIHVKLGIEVSKSQTIHGLMMLRVLLATIRAAQGDFEQALAELAELNTLSQQMTMSRMVEAASDIEAFVHLQYGNLTAVNQWIDEFNIKFDDPLTHFREPRYLTFAHALIVQKRWQDADSLLHNLRQLTQAGGRTERHIRALVLSSLAYQQQGMTVQASEMLQQALLLAEPSSFIRSFISVGQPLVVILAAIKPVSERQKRYIQKLLDNFSDPETNPQLLQLYGDTLIEALSERELELLQLVADGRSNRQIANDLVLALGTVKKHLSNIYGKLQVNNRTQAVARARDLGIL